MRCFKLAVIAGVWAGLSGCTALDATDATDADTVQSRIDQLARTLDVTYAIDANRPSGCRMEDGHAIDEGPCYLATLTFTSPQDIPGSDWEIYYSQVTPLHADGSDQLDVVHVNGDLHVIRPAESFPGFKAGEPVALPLLTPGSNLTEAKMMPNFYVVAEGAQARTIASTALQTDPETGLVVRPYVVPFSDPGRTFSKGPDDITELADAAFIYRQNAASLKDAGKGDPDVAIIPTPRSLVRKGDGARLDVSRGLDLDAADLPPQTRIVVANHFARAGIATGRAVPLDIGIGPSPDMQAPNGKSEGSYTLDVSGRGVTIRAFDEAGAFHALMSLAALAEPQDGSLPHVTIEDAPRYGFRGLHVDVARNFHSKAAILAIMDQMAAYKLNTLHLHLADDEGWRLELPSLPELTDVGSKRCHDPLERSCLLPQLGSGPTGEGYVNGYYSVEDYTEILQAATARHIEVIPSLDMPGHARAAIKSMEARHDRLMEAGKVEDAVQYLLSDPEDASEYSSIQYYSDNTINPCRESTYQFIATMLDDVIKLHADAGHPLRRYHIGADETAGAWTASPMCETFLAENHRGVSEREELSGYFIARVANMIAERGLVPGAWNDGLADADPEALPGRIQSNLWGALPWGGATAAHDHANRGWDAVVSIPDALYFDFPYEAHPSEGGYYWAARRVNTHKVFSLMPDNLPAHAEFWRDGNERPFVIDDGLQLSDTGEVTHRPMRPGAGYAGLQGQIWTETVPTRAELEYRLFPRVLALAERAWHAPDWELPYDPAGKRFGPGTGHVGAERLAARDRDWTRFAARLGERELARLDAAGMFYRVPTPGAVIEDGRLKANIAFPGLAMEYKMPGGDWERYAGVVRAGETAMLRAVSADGRRYSRSVVARRRE